MRNPQLVKLPIPSPSIPVLAPVLSPLVGGSNTGGTTTTSTLSTAPQTSPSASSSGNGGGNSSDTSSSGGGNGSSSSSTGSISSSDASPADSSSSGSTPSSPGTTHGDATDGTDDGTTYLGGGLEGSTGGTISSALDRGASSPGSVNLNPSSGVNIPSSLDTGTSGSVATGTSFLSGTAQDFPIPTQGAPEGTTDSGNHDKSGHGVQPGTNHALPGAAIAGLVITLLFVVLATFFFIVRRRSRARRLQQTNLLWISRFRPLSETGQGRDRGATSTASIRSSSSSFGTSLDHFNRARRSSDFIQALPPMAQVGRENNYPFTSFSEQVDDPFRMDRRQSGTSEISQYLSNSQCATLSEPIHNAFSAISIGSTRHCGSEDSGYFFRYHDITQPYIDAPTPVCSFSPSESFSLHKPPNPISDPNSLYSRPSSVSSYSRTTALPILTVSSINDVIDFFSDNNPFDDPATNEATDKFGEPEIICRSFRPTFPDELAVNPCDSVRVLQAFDDGWAIIEKVHQGDAMRMGNKTTTACERGLIPIDCLRKPGQDLMTFIAAKRMSSYGESIDWDVYTAVNKIVRKS